MEEEPQNNVGVSDSANHAILSSSTMDAAISQEKEAHLKEVTVPKVLVSKKQRQGTITGTNWFLTFPRCEVSKETALKNLQDATRIQIKGCLIAQERHEDGGHHLHVGLWLHKAVRVPPSYFDFIVGKHGNYLRMKSGYATINYLMKEDQTPTSYGVIPVPGSVEAQQQTHSKAKRESQPGGSRSKSPLSISITQLIQSGASEREVHDLAPGYFLQHKQKITEYITWWRSQQVSTPLLIWKGLRYNGTDSNTQLIVDWLNLNIKKKRDFKQEQLFVSGPANTLKTSLLMKLFKYVRAYEIPTEDFYDMYPSPEPELSWMDEYKGSKTIQWINLYAQGAPMTLRIKGGQKLKVTNHPLVVMSNLTIQEIYHKALEKNPQLLLTLESRFLMIHLVNPIDLEKIEFLESDLEQQHQHSEGVQAGLTSDNELVLPATSVGRPTSISQDLTLLDTGARANDPGLIIPSVDEDEVDNHEYFAKKMRQKRVSTRTSKGKKKVRYGDSNKS